MDFLIFMLQMPLVGIGILILCGLLCSLTVGLITCFEKKPLVTSLAALIVSLVLFGISHYLNQQRLVGRTMEAGPAPVLVENE
jgi:hypothetical protein